MSGDEVRAALQDLINGKATQDDIVSRISGSNFSSGKKFVLEFLNWLREQGRLVIGSSTSVHPSPRSGSVTPHITRESVYQLSVHLQPSKQHGSRSRHQTSSSNSSKLPPAQKQLDLNDPELFPRLGSQADLQTRSNSSSLSRRRINPTPVTSLTKSHPAVSTFPPSSLIFAVPEEEAPKQKSFARVAAKGKDPTNKSQQAQNPGVVNSVTGKDPTNKGQQAQNPEVANGVIDSPSLPLTMKTECIGPVHPSLVCCVPQLERVGGLYAALIKGRWIANVFGEMYFVVQLLTAASDRQISLATRKTDFTLFHSVSDCVYFASVILEHLTEAFSVLSDKTIALLVANSRVQLFKPSVADCLLIICKGKVMDMKANLRPVSLESSASHIEHFRRQLFVSDRSFHSFKKQRDVLYAVVRAWEGQWLNPDWTVDEQFGTTLRLMSNELYHHGILCQFTQLFVQLLLQLSSTEGPVVPKDVRSLPEEYKQLDSIKLKRLEERLVKPTSQGGPCPPPSFPGFQSCFIDIILSARSAAFNQHLTDQLTNELFKKWQLLVSSVVNEKKTDQLPSYETVQSMVSELCVLAKFLGFVEFLPYRSPSSFSTSALSAMSAMRSGCCLSCDVIKLLDDAECNGCLMLVVQWLVQYLSQIDVITLHTETGRDAVGKLFAIYQASASWEWTILSASLVFCLGWLFESCVHIQGLFYSEEKFTANCKIVNSGLGLTCNDMRSICPFIDELQVVLSQSATGVGIRSSPLRKITPIQPYRQTSSPLLANSKIQTDLRDNFFRNQPKHLKEVVSICSRILITTLPNDVWDAVEANVNDLVKTAVEKSGGFIQDAAAMVPIVMKDVMMDGQQIEETVERLCKERTCQALSALMPALTQSQVINVAAHIVYEEAKQPVTESLYGQLSSAVKTLVHRMIKQLGDNEVQYLELPRIQ